MITTVIHSNTRLFLLHPLPRLNSLFWLHLAASSPLLILLFASIISTMSQSTHKAARSPLRPSSHVCSNPFSFPTPDRRSPVPLSESNRSRPSPISLTKKSPRVSLPLLKPKTPSYGSLGTSPIKMTKKRDAAEAPVKAAGKGEFPNVERKKEMHRRVNSEKTLGKTGAAKPAIVKPPRPSGIRAANIRKTEALHRRIQSLQASPIHRQDLSTCSSDKAVNLTSFDPKETPVVVSYIESHYLLHHCCPPTLPDMYFFLDEIGAGASGKVYSAIHKLTAKPVAVKCLSKEYLEERNHRAKVAAEIAILKRITHIRIVRLLEVFETTVGELYIVLELVRGGDLLQYVREKGKIPECDAKLIFRQMAEAVQVIHRHETLHRDLKLDNVLIDPATFSVKICDFGISRPVQPGIALYEQSGTPAYLAPEVVAGGGYEGYSSDMWSLGVCLYAMVSGMVPFRGVSLKDLQKTILRGSFVMPENISEEAKDLIYGLLQLVPGCRLTIEKVMSHPWLQHSPGDPPRVPHISEGHISAKEALAAMRSLGFPPECVQKSLKDQDFNHATATYRLLVDC